MTTRPLEGKVVLDLTTALSGPYATMLLAGLGARVIKIENPKLGGDTSRNNAPYVTADGLSLTRQTPGDMSLSMMMRGRGKESITLNLKEAEGIAILKGLAAKADILVENYSAGVTDRLGIGYSDLRELNPRLIYTAISGFGSQGVPGGGKAMDTIIQALSGVMMTAGVPNDPPVRFGLPVGDLVAPLFAVIGTLSAVVQTEKTGVGQYVDVSMLGALTSLVACEPFEALESLGIPLRTGAHMPRLAPFGTFATADGWFALSAPTDAFARGVLLAMDREDLVDDERFRTRDARVSNADELHGLIGAWAAELPLVEVLLQLELNGAPAAAVRSPGDAVSDPLVLSRGEVEQLVHPEYGVVEGAFGSGFPVSFSDSQVDMKGRAPGLGEHTEEILGAMLGYDAAKVRELRETGVL